MEENQVTHGLIFIFGLIVLLILGGYFFYQAGSVGISYEAITSEKEHLYDPNNTLTPNEIRDANKVLSDFKKVSGIHIGLSLFWRNIHISDGHKNDPIKDHHLYVLLAIEDDDYVLRIGKNIECNEKKIRDQIEYNTLRITRLSAGDVAALELKDIIRNECSLK